MIKERLAAGGAVAAAFVSCLCCLGPLLAVGLGLGAYGVAVEPLRPYLLAASFLALGFGFRRAYRRSSIACGADGSCASQPGSRTTRVVLWCAALMALVIGVVPYAAASLGAARSEAAASSLSTATSESQAIVFAEAMVEIKGMTCTGCETTVRLALERIPGVVSAEVNFERAEAVVDYDPARVSPAEVAHELSRATGYEAAPKEER